jgi:hypothetical protein
MGVVSLDVRQVALSPASPLVAASGQSLTLTNGTPTPLCFTACATGLTGHSSGKPDEEPTDDCAEQLFF